MEYDNLTIKDINELAYLNILSKRPKCTLCNNTITEQDYNDANFYCTIPEKKYYTMIFVHKTCVFKNIKGGC